MDQTKSCIHCGHNSEDVPLISFEYRGQLYWICPQDLPVLIHKPAQLASKVPGLENLGEPAEH
jgi:hypothetical protein